MKNNWLLPEDESIGKFEELEYPTRKILFSRGIKTVKQKEVFLNPEFDDDAPDPFLMKDMKEATERLFLAKKRKEKVCVFGDYDADGITSSAILIEFIEMMGLKPFSYIPNRNKDGYGLNKKAIDQLVEKKVDLIITVDCGVSNFEEVEYAKSKKIDTLILDHHHVPPKIPRAVAVVNPNRKGDPYPTKTLAGVGVVFKFIQATCSKIEAFNNEQLKWMLDLVAIGTIADCVPLIGENRTLVRFGLLVLSKTKRTGLRQLFHVGRIAIDESKIPSSQIVAFQISPRLNAAGRMGEAKIALELLLCDGSQEAKARILALDLEEKNVRRQKVTKEIVDQVKKDHLSKLGKEKIIIAFSPHWELGILGLAAGKISDEFQLPSILLKQQNNVFKGSARSVEGINLVQELELQKKLLTRYGGHSGAAGLEIEKKNFESFSKKIKKRFSEFEDHIFEKKLTIDCVLEIREINNKFVDELEQLEPFGKKNSEPLFLLKNTEIVRKQIVGNGEKHVKMVFSQEENQLEAIGFGFAERFKKLQIGDKLDLVCLLQKNYWNGKSSIQAIIVDFDVCDSI